MRWLNYQHLYYFWNVARLGSFTAASRKLRLAQPTVSAQIKSLEDVLGERLFERQGRGIKLTETGKIAHRYAEQIFSLGQELLDALDGKAEAPGQELRIGIADVVPKAVAYRLIEPALQADGSLMVSCLEDKTERLLGELALGEIDLVIADRPIPPSVKVKAYNHFVGESGISFLASKRLAKLYRKNFPRSLAHAPLLLPTSESAVRTSLNEWFERLGITPRCVGAFQDRALMKIAAREDKGIMPIPTAVVNDVMQEYELERVGSTNEVTEKVFLISTERRLKNRIVSKICSEGQRAMARSR